MQQRFAQYLAAALLLLPGSEVSAADRVALLRSNDVVGIVGGANIVSAQKYGYLETLLRISLPQLNLRIRSVAHEGDTVYEQPRDYNYPTIEKQLIEYRATVVLAQFGQMEALDGTNRLTQFISAYHKLLTRLGQNGRRVALISPFPFERVQPAQRSPDLSARNRDLRAFVQASKALAAQRGIAFLDLFSEWDKGEQSRERLTSDGAHLSALGHWHYDSVLARAFGVEVPDVSLNLVGALSNADWERIRQAVIEKNRLWFNYYRPMNWAFLNGDRTDQPSSRDPFNPKVRWFPDEMRKFEPLLDKADTEIAALASATAP